MEGLRGEDRIAELGRKVGFNQYLYYGWSKEFLEAGKKRLAGDTAREANTAEVKGLRSEAAQLKWASLDETPGVTRKLLSAWRFTGASRRVHRVLQHPALSREPE